MRILVITKYAWDDRIASGNTLSNLFSDWPEAEIHTVYCRDATPKNKCCKNYYSVSPLNFLKNIFTPWRIGREFSLSSQESHIHFFETEIALTRLSKTSKLFSLFYDTLYSTRLWLNKKFKVFLSSVNPDIVFCFGVADAFTYGVVKYLKQNNRIPVVSYFVDDNYKTDIHLWDFHKKACNNRLKELALWSDKRYAISQMMCDAYANIMQTGFELLTKGCRACDVAIKNNDPIRLVYAGNLFYNRNKVLVSLVSALQAIGQEEKTKCHLDIYTASFVSESLNSQLNVEGVSTVHPPKTYEEITKIQGESDIVLHVESFDKEQIEVVRFSFSTKITDCLQSGAMVLAIGPECIASIDYLRNVPGVVVITDIKDLKQTILSLVQDPVSILSNAMATNEYARNEMAIEKVRHRLQNDFVSLIQK